MEFGVFIRNLRHKKEVTLHQVAKETDIDSTILSKIERGIRFPTTLQLENLASYFQVEQELLQSKLIAAKIVNKYGLNETTFNALQIVKEEFQKYQKKENA